MNPDTKIIYKLLDQSLSIESHYQLLNWLQTDVQVVLPHDILVSVWGDFSLGVFYLDVVAVHPLVRTSNIEHEELRAQIMTMLELWETSNMKPVGINIEDGFFDIHKALKSLETNEKLETRELSIMRSCLLHGIQDNRSHDDCLYLFLSEKSISEFGKCSLPLLLPFIDSAFRRIKPLTQSADLQTPTQNVALNPVLTNRECEIMNLVKDGKTNSEIAQILDISRFTVKNHLQNIFSKLNANNRSQATFKYKTMTQ